MTTTPTKTMLTKNTTELRALVQKHVAADQVVQGTYWDSKNQCGCFIGCLNYSYDPSGAESRFGLPIMVQRIAESIFEVLPPCEAKAFFAALPAAVGCDGKDLSRVGWQFLAAELRALPDQPAEIEAAIHPVIAGMELLAAGQEWPAARAAARVAAEAAEAAWAAALAAKATAKAAGWAGETALVAKDAALAARDAAWAAALAARVAALVAKDAALAAKDAALAAAVEAAWAAVRAAKAAGWAAARQRQRDLLLRLIAEAPVVEDAR